MAEVGRRRENGSQESQGMRLLLNSSISLLFQYKTKWFTNALPKHTRTLPFCLQIADPSVFCSSTCGVGVVMMLSAD